MEVFLKNNMGLRKHSDELTRGANIDDVDVYCFKGQ